MTAESNATVGEGDWISAGYLREVEVLFEKAHAEKPDDESARVGMIICRMARAALSAPATTGGLHAAIDAVCDITTSPDHDDASARRACEDVAYAALAALSTPQPAPATTGEGEVERVAESLCEADGYAWGGAMGPRRSMYRKLARDKIAALPPSSGWEAGAQDAALREAVYALERIDCLREVRTDLSQEAMAYEMRSIAKQSLAEIAAIRALPLPPPPSSGEK